MDTAVGKKHDVRRGKTGAGDDVNQLGRIKAWVKTWWMFSKPWTVPAMTLKNRTDNHKYYTMPQISINSLLQKSGPSYPEAIAKPYREELVQTGFRQLLSPEDVKEALATLDDKVALVVLNSVCGCSARVARPGTILSLLDDLVPDELLTLFAGMEKEAVACFRENFLVGLTPSSPNIALFKNGSLIHLIERHQIEGRSAQDIASELSMLYAQHCSKKQSDENKARLRTWLGETYELNTHYLSTE
jgi:putative YphP/YqiW family bacilliredoxin